MAEWNLSDAHPGLAFLSGTTVWIAFFTGLVNAGFDVGWAVTAAVVPGILVAIASLYVGAFHERRKSSRQNHFRHIIEKAVVPVATLVESDVPQPFPSQFRVSFLNPPGPRFPSTLAWRHLQTHEPKLALAAEAYERTWLRFHEASKAAHDDVAAQIEAFCGQRHLKASRWLNLKDAASVLALEVLVPTSLGSRAGRGFDQASIEPSNGRDTWVFSWNGGAFFEGPKESLQELQGFLEDFLRSDSFRSQEGRLRKMHEDIDVQRQNLLWGLESVQERGRPLGKCAACSVTRLRLSN